MHTASSTHSYCLQLFLQPPLTGDGLLRVEADRLRFFHARRVCFEIANDCLPLRGRYTGKIIDHEIDGWGGEARERNGVLLVRVAIAEVGRREGGERRQRRQREERRDR